jgi:Helix-turn-helix domain
LGPIEENVLPKLSDYLVKRNAEVLVLRRDYGKPGRSLRTAAKLGRTCQAVNSKAALLGLSWPLEFRASTKGTSKLSDHQRAEALKRIAAGESYRAIAKTFGVRHATVSRLRSRL